MKWEHGEAQAVIAKSVTAPATVSGEQPRNVPLGANKDGAREGSGELRPASQETCHRNFNLPGRGVLEGELNVRSGHRRNA